MIHIIPLSTNSQLDYINGRPETSWNMRHHREHVTGICLQLVQPIDL